MTRSGLPAGQWQHREFPRFGLLEFAARLPEAEPLGTIEVRGAVDRPGVFGAADLTGVPRVEQVSDFHCVATWSRCGLGWSGYRFRDVYEQVIEPRFGPAASARWAYLRGSDRYRVSVHLDDLLADDVLLADRLDGRPLPRDHGAPLRLVAPGLYGYKNIKHLSTIEFHETFPKRSSYILDHPRGRVAMQERGRILPAWAIAAFARAIVKPSLAFYRRSDRKFGVRS